MSKRKFLNKKISLKPNEIIAIQDIVLEYILSNGWRDYEKFARNLSEKILKRRPETEKAVVQCIKNFAHPFYSFNLITKKEVLKRFPINQVIQRLSNIPEQKGITKTTIIVTQQSKPKFSLITFRQIFPEIEEITIKEAKQLVTKLDMPERLIQDTLRTALRERGATNMTERKSDTSLEIADLEDFSLKVGRRWVSFVSVVKGYNSLKKRHATWKEIAHQIVKAYHGTKPNHILLVLAKDPTDGLITQLVNYGESIGNRNLVILIDPVELARFLHVKKVI